MTGAPAIPTADRKGSSALDRRRPNAHRRHSGLVSVRRAAGGPLPFRRHGRFAGASGTYRDDQLRRRLGYRADRDKPLHRCCARADPILGQIAWQGLCQPLPAPESMRRPNLPDHARIGRVRFRPGRSPAADAAAGACLIRLVRGSPGQRRKGTVPDMTEPQTATDRGHHVRGVHGNGGALPAAGGAGRLHTGPFPQGRDAGTGTSQSSGAGNVHNWTICYNLPSPPNVTTAANIRL